MENIITIENIEKRYEDKILFEHYDLSIQRNERVAIVGKSGSGKTTLLNILGLIDLSFSGQYYYEGKLISKKKF
ncbi:MAG: ATP-binding cassette domain-containing protein [Breznakia sp.]